MMVAVVVVAVVVEDVVVEDVDVDLSCKTVRFFWTIVLQTQLCKLIM